MAAVDGPRPGGHLFSKKGLKVRPGGFDKTGKGNKTPDTRDTPATDFPIHPNTDKEAPTQPDTAGPEQ